MLPFGITCSPCCAIFALQRHVKDSSQPEEEVRTSIEPPEVEEPVTERELHIFSDTSEQAYRMVVYLSMLVLLAEHTWPLWWHVVGCPSSLHTITQLKMCAALLGAQLSKLLENDLNLCLTRQSCGQTDSTAVLAWLLSESCHFKVLVSLSC